MARELAGGDSRIIVFSYANEDAVGFYQKMGMRASVSMMENTDVEWTPFEVK